MTALAERAHGWVASVHPHLRHLERTRDWLVQLDPNASEALQVAALTHDIERAFPDPEQPWDSAVSWDDPDYNRWHQDRCADMVALWLSEQGADPALVAQVDGLVRVHEDGGWPEADLLQAADSLSFLETMPGLVGEWVQSGRATRERAAGKLQNSVDRIAPGLEWARAEGAPLLAAALQRLAAVPAPAEVLAATGLVRQGRVFALARDRFPGMPLFPGHPTFEVLAYRTPQGLRAAGAQPWGPGNDAGLGYMSELVMGTTHSGAHIDAHAHMTIGPEDRWNGGSARSHLGDFGPLRGDATEIPALWRRGVLYDVPGHRGVPFLGKGEPVTAASWRRSRPPRAWPPGPGTWRWCAPGTCVTGRTRSSWPSIAARARTSRPRCSWPSAAWSPPARTPRPTRCSPPPTRASPPTRSRCTPSC